MLVSHVLRGSTLARLFGYTEVLCVVLCSTYSHCVSGSELNSTETCPKRDATAAAVRALLGQSAITSEDIEKIEINDLGERYVVTVKGRTREYTDEMRDCAKRARVAAVFVALTLAPPDIGSADASSSQPEPEVADTKVSRATNPSALSVPAPVPVAPLAPQVQSAAGNWVSLAELGAKVAVAPFNGPPIANWGGLFRGIITSSHWGISLGSDLPARRMFELDTIRIQLARYTTDLSMRTTWEAGPLRCSLDLGPLVALLQLRLNQSGAQRITRWQPGLRAGAVVAWQQHAVSPFLGADVAFTPWTVPIRVEPNGEIGRTPSVWLGLSLGLALGSH